MSHGVLRVGRVDRRPIAGYEVGEGGSPGLVGARLRGQRDEYHWPAVRAYRAEQVGDRRVMNQPDLGERA